MFDATQRVATTRLRSTPACQFDFDDIPGFDWFRLSGRQ
jgi:hypothetical protein